MSWIKTFGYLLISILIYSLISLLLSITPIFSNLIGYTFSNETLLYLQQQYYFNAPMRSLIHGNAGCFLPDSDLGYKQIVGDCYFKNTEFDTVLKFNENGAVLNNHKKNKNAPNIVVVGDSHAIGWGVNYNETFSYLLSNFGYKVTNLSMSSYGTEQEVLAAINSEDFNNVDTIIIQYCNNDLSKNKINISDYRDTEFKYYSNVEKNEFSLKSKLSNASKYYLKTFELIGFYSLPIKSMWNFFDASQKKNIDVLENSSIHKEFIINVLKKYKKELNNKNVIVFYSNGYGVKFTDWDSLESNFNFIDLNLDRSHYYVIDDHLNKSGHEYIAKKLINILSSL